MAAPRDVLAILGPTASGKSALALALAERLHGEIVSCDSMQVYRGMDIGSGKATRDERARVPHHLIDVVEPAEAFHAARWAALAAAAIGDIDARRRVPIVAGGTGLYWRALITGLFDAPPSDPEIRRRHAEEVTRTGVPALHARLAGIDPTAAAAIKPTDLVRTSRALEVHEQTGETMTSLRRKTAPPIELRAFVVLLEPPLPELRRLIAARVDAMVAAGFLDEVRRLRAAGHAASLKPMQSLGYRHMNLHLDGALPLDEAVARTKLDTAAYARRQRTWFKKERVDLRWPHAADESTAAALETAWRATR